MLKILNCYSEKDFRIDEMEKPFISESEMLIEMLYCGLCGSDVIKIFDPALKKPDVYGHEVVGRVAETGSSVQKFKAGDIVVAAHHIPCGVCNYCRHESHTMCHQFKETNIVPGGFSQYIKLSRKHVENTTFKLEKNFDLLKALFIEPLACCIRAMDRIDRLSGDIFSITGAGAIGILFLLLIKLEDLKAVVIDMDGKRLELAEKLGADLVINPSKSQDYIPASAGAEAAENEKAGYVSDKKHYNVSVSDKIKKVFSDGVDAAILTVTNECTVADAVSYVRPGGSINIFGMSEKNSIVPVDFGKIYRNELTIKSTYSSTPETLTRAYKLITTDKVDVSCLISEVLPLSDFKKGLDLMLERKIYKAIYRL